LLDAVFAKTLKSKQSWTIRINKKKEWILLGVCLKNKMGKYNFNGKNINLGEKGHGLYLIGSSGACWSHSH